ncbi:hypothetical protein Ae201684P_020287 [Aphanomyces euteiches]|uniref:Uncharacterized protein n=1 Tax=Aphanomyces euteiches TaxID=100861 RepID=A0A6G0WCX2_9STRA|nr:hypothetical protein Ae201684_016555 [Aphanomyces euteiches]KAH9084024.1 hypothetical protein Ae201684P_020287 [Aphanomyces euteiches]
MDLRSVESTLMRHSNFKDWPHSSTTTSDTIARFAPSTNPSSVVGTEATSYVIDSVFSLSRVKQCYASYSSRSLDEFLNLTPATDTWANIEAMLSTKQASAKIFIRDEKLHRFDDEFRSGRHQSYSPVPPLGSLRLSSCSIE